MTCVVDDAGRLVGIVTDGDCAGTWTAPTLEPRRRRMTRHPITIPVRRGLKAAEERKITSLVVADDDGAIAGVVHLHDLWRTEMI
jgi:arabinose-5-phosphate isomerase